jgi:hypothetical protein
MLVEHTGIATGRSRQENRSLFCDDVCASILVIMQRERESEMLLCVRCHGNARALEQNPSLPYPNANRIDWRTKCIMLPAVVRVIMLQQHTCCMCAKSERGGGGEGVDELSQFPRYVNSGMQLKMHTRSAKIMRADLCSNRVCAYMH